jgi:hypothetical protein
MLLSTAATRDPSLYSQFQYPRRPLDFYETPLSAVKSLLEVIEDDLPSFQVWEPFCGAGAITDVIKPFCRDIVSTDICAYEGFDPDALVDFFDIAPRAVFEATLAGWQAMPTAENFLKIPRTTLGSIGALKGFVPDCIITNPPYGNEDVDAPSAEKCARRSILLMEEQKGDVFFLCRNEWDCAKSRCDLFNHPAFQTKIIIRHRPRWMKGTKGSPRHNYAWYHWSWKKALMSPASNPLIFYAS